MRGYKGRESGNAKMKRQPKSHRRAASGKQARHRPGDNPTMQALLGDGLLDGGFGQRAFERHAAILSDSRLSHPANAHARATVVGQLQRDYGNQYVQRLVDHISRKRTQAAQAEPLIQRDIEFNKAVSYLDVKKNPLRIKWPEIYDLVQAQAQNVKGKIKVWAGDTPTGVASFDPITEEQGNIRVKPPEGMLEDLQNIESTESEKRKGERIEAAKAKYGDAIQTQLIAVAHETRHGLDYFTSETSVKTAVREGNWEERIRSEMNAFAVQTALTRHFIDQGRKVPDRYKAEAAAFNEQGFQPGGKMFETIVSYMALYKDGFKDLSADEQKAEAARFLGSSKGKKWLGEALAAHDLHYAYQAQGGRLTLRLTPLGEEILKQMGSA